MLCHSPKLRPGMYAFVPIRRIEPGRIASTDGPVEFKDLWMLVDLSGGVRGNTKTRRLSLPVAIRQAEGAPEDVQLASVGKRQVSLGVREQNDFGDGDRE